MKKAIAAAVAAAVMGNAPAGAATMVVETHYFDGLAWDEFFDPFDASLGTLDSIDFEVSRSVGGTLALLYGYNSSGVPITRPYDAEISVRGEMLLYSGDYQKWFGTTRLEDTISLSGEVIQTLSGYIELPLSYTNTTTYVLSDKSVMDGFAGTKDNFIMAGWSIYPTFVNAPGMYEYGFFPTRDIHITTRYNYTPLANGIPEPSTWAMLIVGFGLVGGAVRAARRKAVMPAAC